MSYLTLRDLDKRFGSTHAVKAINLHIERGELIVQPPTLPLAAQTVPFAAWMGGADSNDESLWQTVTVPASATALRLRGQIRIATLEVIPVVYDFLAIELRSSSNVLLQTLFTYDDDDANPAWTAFMFSAASAYAGQTVRLYFHATTDSSDITNFFLDSLVLEALVCQ